MSASPAPHDSAPALSASDHRAGLFSIGASKAGRELVWLMIAVAFCIVEAVVFVTDLPVSKILSRRDLPKANSRATH